MASETSERFPVRSKRLINFFPWLFNSLAAHIEQCVFFHMIPARAYLGLALHRQRLVYGPPEEL